jgi:hypothetical protein
MPLNPKFQRSPSPALPKSTAGKSILEPDSPTMERQVHPTASSKGLPDRNSNSNDSFRHSKVMAADPFWNLPTPGSMKDNDASTAAESPRPLHGLHRHPPLPPLIPRRQRSLNPVLPLHGAVPGLGGGGLAGPEGRFFRELVPRAEAPVRLGHLCDLAEGRPWLLPSCRWRGAEDARVLS